MAVSKRLRYEVLKRDNHTCQYCGEKAPNVTLHVDHVIPVTLGGTDKPDNLVAACQDCNLGKTSIPADAPLVAAVGKMAATYALEMTERMTIIRGDLERDSEYLCEFEDAWNVWKYDGTEKTVPLPPDYENSVYRWAKMGVPIQLIERAIKTAMTKSRLRGPFPEFTYMAGIVWRTLEETDVPIGLTEATVRLYTAGELEERLTNERIEAYLQGCATRGA
ncbi:hypothetical protein StoSoilB13_02750 [Arthrobacter sp. StoSoilB13]|nr:hypothetical protein StoSoilB13_02750 [Arthrobacter sp. StoSoilB13]